MNYMTLVTLYVTLTGHHFHFVTYRKDGVRPTLNPQDYDQSKFNRLLPAGTRVLDYLTTQECPTKVNDFFKSMNSTSLNVRTLPVLDTHTA